VKKQPRPRRIYSEEFKQEAVARCNAVGPTQTCQELDIAGSVLNRWRKQYSEDISVKVGKEKPSYEDLEKENKRLKKELSYVEDINDILKKSTAIFSKSHLKGSK
jgi:transposase-like protein